MGDVGKETGGAKSGIGVVRKIVYGLLAVVVVVVVFLVAFGSSLPSSRARTAVGRAVRGPQVICDEEIVVPAGGAQIRGFRLPSGRPLLVEVQGTVNADNGFSAYLIDANQWETFKAGKQFRHYPSFEGKKVRGFRKKGTVPAGNYGLVVANTENLLMSMTVKVKIVADPE